MHAGNMRHGGHNDGTLLPVNYWLIQTTLTGSCIVVQVCSLFLRREISVTFCQSVVLQDFVPVHGCNGIARGQVDIALPSNCVNSTGDFGHRIHFRPGTVACCDVDTKAEAGKEREEQTDSHCCPQYARLSYRK